jgi:hypothetical protein
MAHITRAATESDLKLTWQDVDGDPVALVHIPPASDGETVYRLDTVETHAGELYVAGHTVRAGGNSSGTPLNSPRPARRTISLRLHHPDAEASESLQR